MYRKVLLKKPEDSEIQKIYQEQQMYNTLSRTFSSKFMTPAEHKSNSSLVRKQMSRPDTCGRLRKDYQEMLDLAQCNERVRQSRKKSLQCFRKMCNINLEDTQPAQFRPLYIEIKTGESKIASKRFTKCDLNNYLHNFEAANPNQTLEEFMINNFFRKEAQNNILSAAKVDEKLRVFGQLLEQQKTLHITRIKKILSEQRKKTPSLNREYQFFLVNRYILSQLLLKITKDCKNLSLKLLNEDIYTLIKNEMVGQLVHERKFAEVFTMVQREMSKNATPKCHGQKMIKKIGSRGRNGFMNPARLSQKAQEDTGSRKNKENQLSNQFQRLYRNAQQKMSLAENEFFANARKNITKSLHNLKSNKTVGTIRNCGYQARDEQ